MVDAGRATAIVEDSDDDYGLIAGFPSACGNEMPLLYRCKDAGIQVTLRHVVGFSAKLMKTIHLSLVIWVQYLSAISSRDGTHMFSASY